MANKDYRKAYESAAKELETLLQDKKRIDGRILSLRKTMNVLSTLIEESGDDGKWLDLSLRVLEEVEPSLTDDILAAINRSTQPMTTTDVLNELKKVNRAVITHKNPLATINAVLKRLEEQGKVDEVEKDGRKAWQPVTTAFTQLFGHVFDKEFLANPALAGLGSAESTKSEKNGPGLMKSMRNAAKHKK
jgi:hypothetical protein